MEQDASTARSPEGAGAPPWPNAASATFALGTLIGLALGIASMAPKGSWLALTLGLGALCGPLAAVLAGGALQVRARAEPLWMRRILAWVLGCASLGLWVVAPVVALTGPAAWVVAVAWMGRFGGRTKATSLTLVALASAAALFVWDYWGMTPQTDLALAPLLAPSASALTVLWALLLLRGRTGRLLM
jgi:hypothetical protein